MRVERYGGVLLCLLLCSGCATARHAVPSDLVGSVRVFGMEEIRAVSGSPSESFKKDFLRLAKESKKEAGFFHNFSVEQRVYVLAISGGGDKGAYGAGLLKGWTRAGSRPVFKVVTGISTGALIAPFAFLGSEYDDTLKEFYTTHSTKDILRPRFPHLGLLSSDSLVSTRPLERLIERYIDEGVLREIAAEYNKGRRLYVGTTHLDAQRLVIWDLGKIASSGDANALKLFRKVILASASIPIAFPPVRFDVVVNNTTYDELHVDGGITRQVFFLYDVLQGFDKAAKEKGFDVSRIRYSVYVIRNGYVDPVYKEIPDTLPAIAERTVDTTINAQGVGDLYQLYIFSKGRQGDFNLASIPVTHSSKAKELFDPREMAGLFDLGFKQASGGYPWRKAPPGVPEE